MGWNFPVWLEVVCLTIWVVIITKIAQGIYKNYLTNIFSRKKTVDAELISKVEEEYHETQVYTNRSSGTNSSATGLRSGKTRTAYRLFFRIEKKVIELDVERSLFVALPETGTGKLTYKGNMYQSFVCRNSVYD